MISRLLRMLLIGFVLSFIIVVTAFGATPDEQLRAMEDVHKTCRDYQRICLYKVIKNNTLNAYTDGVTIFIYTGLLNSLSEDELRSVLYHELSHILLLHLEHRRELLYRKFMVSMWEIKTFETLNEIEADTLATHLLLSNGYPSKLADGLLRMVPRELIDKSTLTHPSVIKRIKHINKIELMYN